MFRSITKNSLLALLVLFACALPMQLAMAGYVQQGPKLVGTGYSGSAYQGRSVAISADGNTAIVGGYGDNGNAGAAWIFVRSNGVWTQQGGKLVGTGATGAAYQGKAVALSADGNTAIVGGYGDNGNAGAAWIFVRSNGVWAQQGNKLIGSGAIGSASQGYAVTISGDGNTVAIGGNLDNDRLGAVWVFTRNNGAWTQQGSKLVGSGSSDHAQQGSAVALSGDGNTILFGGNLNVNNVLIGSALVFTRNAGTWSQFGNIMIGTGAIGVAQQGFSVALSADGNTALVGGNYDDDIVGETAIGAAWVFIRGAGQFRQQGGKLVGSGYVGGFQYQYQGSSVALSGDGNIAFVGGIGETWVFARSNGRWSQLGPGLVGSGGTGSHGLGVALSVDGSTAIVGGPGDSSGIGAAWIWTRRSPHDFNGDSTSDIVWRNSAGNNAMWLMSGATIASVERFVDVSTNWYIVGQRDFDGDGKTDLLWASTSGDVAIWLMNGSTILSVASLGNVGANWGVAGTADFDGDGKGDILWRNTAGDHAIWFMNGTSVASVAGLGNVSTNWGVAGTGDFNGDGKGDILWRSTAGDNAISFMNGATIASVVGVGNVPVNWSIVGTADFDADGKSDILWRNSAGDNAIWLMNGSTIISIAGLGNIPTNWSIASAGDYNGDGKGDILWRNTAGDNAVWFMNSTTISSAAGLGNVPTNWTIQNMNAN